MNKFFLAYLVVFFFFLSWTASAYPEKELASGFEEKIRPFLNQAKQGRFIGQSNAEISYSVFKVPGDANGSIVILPGFTESYIKYAEVAWDLVSAGYDVFILDHRGMGHSGRFLANPQIVHVENFSDYVKDAEIFVRQVVLPQQRGDLFLLAHSTGGLIASYLLRDLPVFTAAALSSPLLVLNTKPYPEWLTYTVVSLSTWFGFGGQYVPGRHDFDPKSYKIEESSTTTSLIRAEIQQKQWLEDSLLVQGGPSNNWLREIIKASWARIGLAKSISIPILILSAEDERYVKKFGQEVFCSYAKDCRIVEFGQSSRHELLMERDEIRDAVFANIVHHFRR